jgi:hypothetical protein
MEEGQKSIARRDAEHAEKRVQAQVKKAEGVFRAKLAKHAKEPIIKQAKRTSLM